jgi:hypothetical protein
MLSSSYDENINETMSHYFIRNIHYSNFQSCLRYGITLWGADNGSNKEKNTLWLLVRKQTIPSGRHLSEKLLPPFAGRGVSHGQRNRSLRPLI